MMNTSTSVVRLARRLRMAAAIGTVAVPLATGAAVLTSLLGSRPGTVTATLDKDDLPWGMATTIALAMALLIVCALLSIQRMLTDVETGNLFSPSATAHFRRFATWLVAASASSLVLPAAAHLVIGFGHEPHVVALTVEGRDVLLLFLSLLLVLVARLFETAARYREDSLSIV